MRVDRLPALALTAALALAMAASAVPARAGEPVSVEAGSISYEHDGRVLQATGGVTATWNRNTLTADAVSIEQDSKRLLSSGDLVLDTPDFVLRAASCDLRFDDETGVLEDVSVELKDRTLSFGGKTVRKHLGRRYVLEDGYYTTCETEPGKSPEWELSGSEVDVEVDGTGRVTNGAFRVRGVPVVYVPYAVFPVSDRRRSGLLLPRIGVSSQRGFIFSQPVYWAVDKHRDLTATLGLESSRRVGLDLGFRYAPAKTTFGELGIAYYNEAIRGEFDPDFDVGNDAAAIEEINNFDDEDRAVATITHRQRVFDETDLYVDALAVTDDFLLREVDSVDTGFFQSALRRTRRYTDSHAGLLTHDGFLSFGIRASGYQDLGFGRPDRLTLHRPSEAWLRADGERFGIGYAVDSSLSTFSRREGADGQRFDVATTLERAITRHGPLRSHAWARGRLTGYRMAEQVDLRYRDFDGNGDRETRAVRVLDNRAGRALGEAGFDMRSVLSRRYIVPRGRLARAFESVAGRFGAAREDGPPGAGTEPLTVRHTIEPFSSLRYTSATRDSDLPLYDDVDRIDGRTTGTYGVSQRLILDDIPSGRTTELARVSLAQTYNFDERVLDDHFSDVDLTVAVRPTERVSISGLASYNVGTTDLRGAVGWFSFDRFRIPYATSNDSSVDLVYRFVRGEGLSTVATDDLETAEARGLFAFTDRVQLGLNGRFDFPSGSFVESGGGIRIQSACKCWSIDLGVTNRKNPNETQFRLSITLAGLGELGSSALDYQTPGLAGFEHGTTGYWRYGW